MIKYFVKKHCEATELLNVGVGRVQDYYYGKAPLGGYVCKDREPVSFEVTQYGLDNLAEAEELLNKLQVTGELVKYWVTTFSIVEIIDSKEDK